MINRKSLLSDYFNNLTKLDKLVWTVVGLLAIKWLLGPASSFSGSHGLNLTFYTFRVPFWAVLFYAVAFLAIRLGFSKAFIGEKKAILILFGLCCVPLLIMILVVELQNAQVQFLLSLAVICLQIYAYRQLPPTAH